MNVNTGKASIEERQTAMEKWHGPYGLSWVGADHCLSGHGRGTRAYQVSHPSELETETLCDGDCDDFEEHIARHTVARLIAVVNGLLILEIEAPPSVAEVGYW